MQELNKNKKYYSALNGNKKNSFHFTLNSSDKKIGITKEFFYKSLRSYQKLIDKEATLNDIIIYSIACGIAGEKRYSLQTLDITKFVPFLVNLDECNSILDHIKYSKIELQKKIIYCNGINTIIGIVVAPDKLAFFKNYKLDSYKIIHLISR